MASRKTLRKHGMGWTAALSVRSSKSFFLQSMGWLTCAFGIHERVEKVVHNVVNIGGLLGPTAKLPHWVLPNDHQKPPQEQVAGVPVVGQTLHAKMQLKRE